ncbi:MAG: metal ABC transporter permease, partial [Phycisphaerales bacterium JB058]
MSDALHHFIAGDLVALLACTLAVMTCGVLGSYLVLKRESLMGDAISHAVLPGLVVAFMISHSRAPVPMFIGAGVAAGLTVLLTMLVRRFGGVEPGAAMGVVFSVMFALGVYLIESETLRDIDLDASCVLYGQVEYLVWWKAPDDLSAYLKLSTYTDTGIPSALWALAAIFVVAVAFVLVFFKELRITTFDPQMARAAGFPAWLVQGALVLLVALAVVASFQAIGSILVIAMLICPAATARMLTDRLGVQVLLAGLVAGLCAIAG